MKQIISKDNKLIKEFSKLKQKKYIEKSNKILLEGIKLINEAEKRNITFDAVFTNFETEEEFDCPSYVLSESAFNMLSGTKTSQGIIAVASLPKNSFELPKKNFLVLDGIQDPGNLGTIIRTAVACDFCEIYCLNCVDFRNEKVVRSTMGTVFDCKIMKINFDELKKLLNFKLYCAEMDGQDVFNTKITSKQFGIVIGNEANGISQDIKDFGLEKVSLKMENNVESLNAAVACGVLMYALSSNQK